MKRSIAVVIVLVALRADGQMLQSISLEPARVQLTVGSSAVIRANAKLGCCSHFPWRVVFRALENGIASVNGLLEEPAISADVTIVALRPGVTHVVSPAIGSGTWPLATIEVVCGAVPPLIAESPQVATAPGRVVPLRIVVTPATGPAFSWYLGRIGDTSHPLASSGAEFPFVSDAAGTYYVWVMSVASCGASSAEFRIDVVPPRRRSLRR